MIRFYCTCGKRLKVRAAEAGRVVKCPYCGKKVRAAESAEAAGSLEALAAPVAEVVGAPPQPAARPAAGGARQDPAAGLAALAQAVHATQTSNGGAPQDPVAKVRGKMKAANGPASAQVLSRRHNPKPNRLPLLAGIGGGVLLLGALIGLAMLFKGSGGGSSPAPTEEAPTARRTTPGEMFKNVPFQEN